MGVHEKERLEQEQIIQVEKEIREKLAKQEQEIKAWQKRVENRNVFAERERQKRQQILDELREEFGYEVNPDDQQFAEKIAEKEKEMAKAIKAERKLKKQEHMENLQLNKKLKKLENNKSSVLKCKK